MAKPKTTPRIDRAERELQRALDGMTDNDLWVMSQRARLSAQTTSNQLQRDDWSRISRLAHCLQELKEARRLLDEAPETQDMFAEIDPRDFRATLTELGSPLPGMLL